MLGCIFKRYSFIVTPQFIEQLLSAKYTVLDTKDTVASKIGMPPPYDITAGKPNLVQEAVYGRLL